MIAPRPGGTLSAPSLSAAQIQRYARQILLPSLGGAGQARIASGSVLLHGDAPLCSLYLAAGGLGRLVYTGSEPDIAARDPGFSMGPGRPGDAADVVVDLADGAAHRAADAPALSGAIVGDRLLLGTDALDGVAGDDADPALRALLEILAAGEAFRLLAGLEAHSYEF